MNVCFDFKFQACARHGVLRPEFGVLRHSNKHNMGQVWIWSSHEPESHNHRHGFPYLHQGFLTEICVFSCVRADDEGARSHLPARKTGSDLPHEGMLRL